MKLLLVVFVLVGVLVFALARHLHQRHHCTHGASSIGPMTITGGRATGSTVPHTEACLP